MTLRQEVQQEIARRAAGRCEYCGMHQSLQGATFHVEHVIPRCRGGVSSPDNLAWACPSCNLYKADRVGVSSSDATVRLFNPREDRWSEHFRWEEYQIIGRTKIGRATVESLRLNHERRLRIRQAEQVFGLFPPEH